MTIKCINNNRTCMLSDLTNSLITEKKISFFLYYYVNSFDYFLLVLCDQEAQWRETVVEGPLVKMEAQQGRPTLTEVDPKMLHDITTKLSRLMAKSKQLIGNHTTNLAECRMHIRAKFDGGKVIKRSQSGSWKHRCMGAGLRYNRVQSGDHRHVKT